MLKRCQDGLTIAFQLLTSCSLNGIRKLTLPYIPPAWCCRIKATLTAVITGYTSLPTNYRAVFWLAFHCEQDQRRFSVSHNKQTWVLTLRIQTSQFVLQCTRLPNKSFFILCLPIVQSTPICFLTIAKRVNWYNERDVCSVVDICNHNPQNDYQQKYFHFSPC